MNPEYAFVGRRVTTPLGPGAIVFGGPPKHERLYGLMVRLDATGKSQRFPSDDVQRIDPLSEATP